MHLSAFPFVFIFQKRAGEMMNDKEFDTVISAEKSAFKVDIKELLSYKYLIFLFVKRDFIAKYKQTVLGPMWAVIQPFLTTVVFTAVFGNFAQISTNGVPAFIFYLCSTVIWQFFSSSLNASSSILISNSHLLSKVYFPRLVLPVSAVLSKLISFAIQLAFFLVFFFIYLAKGEIEPNIYIAMTPLLLVHVMALSLGVGLLISACTIKYRDLVMLISFAVQLWMYATPVIYPADAIAEKWRNLILINPMAPIVETFRYAFLGTSQFYGQYYAISCVSTIIILFIGLFVFNKAQKSFADTI